MYNDTIPVDLKYFFFPLFWLQFFFKMLEASNEKFGSSHWRCSVKMVFLDSSQNSQEYTCARVSFLIKLQACEFSENFKNTFSTRTPPNDCF